MQPSKFSLADLLTVLAALTFGFFCFLSLHFLSLGQIQTSIIIAAIIALLLGMFAFFAKLFKRTSKNFKTCIIAEWICLFLFVAVACVAIFPFSHYFAVSDQKDTIQRKVTAGIAQAENMYTDYEHDAENRETLYKSRLRTVVAAKGVNPQNYAGCGFVADVDDNEQIDNKMFKLHAQLFPSNYTEIKQNNTLWLVNAKKTIKDWKPIGLVAVVNEVEHNATKWVNELVKFSTYREQGEMFFAMASDFSYPLSFDDVKDTFEYLGDPTLLSVACAIGLYFLMVLSYLVTKRHFRYPGLKLIFCRRKGVLNEL